MRKILRMTILGLALSSLMAGLTLASTLRMDVAAGNWNVGGNWDGGTVPTNATADLANVGSIYGSGVAIATAEVTDTQDASRIILGETPGSNGTINIQSGGNLTDYNRLLIGASTSTGKVNVLAGGSYTHSGIGGFVVGQGAGSNGTLSVDGGTVNSTVTNGLSLGSSSAGTNATALLEVKNGGTFDFSASTNQALCYDDWTLSVSGSSSNVDFGGQFRALSSGTYQVAVDGNLNVDLAGSLRLDANIMTVKPAALGALADGDYTVMSYNGLASGTTLGDLALDDQDPSGTWSIKSLDSSALVLTYAAIPEPTSLTLLAIAGGLVWMARKQY